MTVLLWIGYPIVFALTEGAAKISVDAEVIAYGVLDVVSIQASAPVEFPGKPLIRKCSFPLLSLQRSSLASTSSSPTPTLTATRLFCLSLGPSLEVVPDTAPLLRTTKWLEHRVIGWSCDGRAEVEAFRQDRPGRYGKRVRDERERELRKEEFTKPAHKLYIFLND